MIKRVYSDWLDRHKVLEHWIKKDGHTVTEAARRMGIGRVTVFAWRKRAQVAKRRPKESWKRDLERVS